MSLRADIEKRKEGVYIIRVEGYLDSETCVDFESKIKPFLIPPTKVLILDMKGLDYIASSGLGVIFNAKKILEKNKGSLILTDLKPQIKKVFEIIKAMPKEKLFQDMEEVDTYLGAMQKKETEKRELS